MSINTPLEKLLNKSEGFLWTQDCDKAFKLLKQKLSTAPILTYPNWQVEFHVHIDTSTVELDTILVQLREGNLEHPIYFSSQKLSQVEHNYTATEREGLAMVYALQKFRNYSLGSHFKFFYDHFSLNYLVNKIVLEGHICMWFLLFQEFSFEVIIKPYKLNVGPDHLSRLELRESGVLVDEQLLDVDLFRIEPFLIICWTFPYF
jgi:hypothetical protein